MWFLVFALFLIIIAVLLFTIAFKMEFVLDTNNNIIKLTTLWLYPVFKAEVFMQENKPTLEAFLFNIRIYKKAITTKGQIKFIPQSAHLIKRIKLSGLNFKANYGFRDKFVVGTVCGFINFIESIFKIDSIDQTPNFISDNDYIYVRATARVNIKPGLKSLASH